MPERKKADQIFDRILPTGWRVILSGMLIATAPLLGLALFVYITVSYELETLSSEQSHANAFTVANILEEKLKGMISRETVFVARTTLIDGIVSGNVQEMQSSLQELAKQSTDIERVFITSPKGILLADYPAVRNTIGKDYSRYDWYREATRSWTPYVSGLFQSDFRPEQSVFAITVPIKSNSGTIIGLLVLQPGANFIINAFAPIRHTVGKSLLVDSKGMVIYQPDQVQGETADISHTPVFVKIQQKLDGYEKEKDALTGEKVINAYSSVKISGWGVITESYLDELLAPMKNVTRATYFFTAIMLLISAWFAYQRSKMINSRKKVADDLQIQQTETAESNRLLEEAVRVKYDFLANMSHELRTPLNAVIGFSEVLQDQLCGPINPKQLEYVNDIHSSGKHLLTMINDILDLSRVESGNLELHLGVFSLREALNDTLNLLREKGDKNALSLQINLDPEADVRITADQKKFKLIMFNLVSNAVKFTPAGGAVDVSAHLTDNYIEISVADSGIGIRESEIGNLFQTFAQLDSLYTREYQGAGLGLALTRQLVDLHGGTIRVESLYGSGSRFIFTVPLRKL